MKGIKIPILITIVIYGVSFLFSTVYGYDAPTRALMTWRWASNPFFITSSNHVTWVFGPMFFYLNSLSLLLFKDPNFGPRLFTTILGAASVIPLYSIARNIFGEREAFYTALAFPFFSLLIHLAVPGDSEPIAYFTLLTSVALLLKSVNANSVKYAILAGLFMSASCATRYDVWLFIPVIGFYLLTLFFKRKERKLLTVGFVFVGVSLVFPLSWMAGHYLNGFTLFHFVTSARELDQSVYGLTGNYSIARMIYNAVFLPALLTVSLTPLIFVLALIGIWQQFRKRRFDVIAWCLIAYLVWFYATLVVDRATVMTARFGVLVGLLLLIYVGKGLLYLLERFRSKERAITSLTYVSAATILVVLALFGAPRQGLAAKLNSVSPIVQQPKELTEVVAALQKKAQDGYSMVMDTRYYGLRMLYLKLFADWDKIAEFRGVPGEFSAFVDSTKPDVLVRSSGNRRMHDILDPRAKSLWFGADSIHYALESTFGEYMIYGRAKE